MSTWGDPPSDADLEMLLRTGLADAAQAVQVRPALHRIWARIRHRRVWTTTCCGIPDPCTRCGACLCADSLPRCPDGCTR